MPFNIIFLWSEIMNENLENYSELIDRLKSGDRSTFRNDLGILVQKFGSHRPLEDVAKLSFENKELLRVLLELTKENGQGNKLGVFAFHTSRQVGPIAIPYIREEWKRDEGAPLLHYLHLCLMDIIGASTIEEEWQHWMPIIAEQEIPLWIAMLPGKETKSRGLIAWSLGLLTKYAPAQAEQVGRSIIDLLEDTDYWVQIYTVRGLHSIGDKTMLQDALFPLARVAHDPGPLELLLSLSENIDVNARDSRGKTALMYAEESGNKKKAEMLEQAGAME